MLSARILHGMIGLAGSCALGACGASGKAWVQEPESGFTAADPPEVRNAALLELGNANPPAAVAGPESESAQQPVSDAPRTRLDHVVSLGEGAAAGPATTRDDTALSYGGPVVNIYNVVQPSTLGYGYGYGYGYAGYRPGWGGSGGDHGGRPRPTPHVSAPTTPALGGDWQPAASHGPSFPYSTAPASPWR